MDESTQPRLSNKRLAARMLLVVVGMFGFGYLMVPIYDVLCDITGLNGKTGRAAEASLEYEVDENRELRVEFVSTLNESMALEFLPGIRSMTVQPGRVYEMNYRARNGTDRVMIGQAVPSVVPGAAATHFKKTECFCFTQQRFEPGEEREMPVRFVVDPSVPRSVRTITLSYTFFDITAKQG